jgi:outer membrane protein assembly factor BamB
MAWADDWPQYQGINRDGISKESGIARAWPGSGPKVLWTAPMGEGYAGATVKGGEVFVLDRVDAAKDVLRCIDLKTGKELWSFTHDAPGEVSHNGSRTMVTVDDARVYAVGLMGDFYCVDRKSHQPVWTHNIVKDFGSEEPGWGITQAPQLYKNLVIVAPQALHAFVAAYDQATGNLVWKTEKLGKVGYVPPVVASLAGVDQVVMIPASGKNGQGEQGKVGAFSAEDGKPLWTYDGWHCSIPIPYPQALPGDRLFITGGYGAGSVMLQVTKEGNAFAVKELFKLPASECGSQIHQPILYKDHLYLNDNSNEREGGMICLTLDGKVKWRTKDTSGLPTFERGTLVMVDGLILNLDGKKGTLHLIDPSPDGYKELAKCKLFGGKEIWAPMAIADGKLIARNQTEMKCLDLKNP